MKILKYEFIGKDKYNVFLDNDEVITLYEKVITENEILLRNEIDKQLYKKILIDNNICELELLSIKYISIRLRSTKEIKDYLIKKGATVDDADIVIEKLIKSNYINDTVFTKAFIKDKLNFTTMGDYKLKMELQRLGVSSSIIEEEIIKIDETLLEEKMKKIIEKDLHTNKKYSGINLKNKIYNHLLSQGYSKEKIIANINKYDF